QSYRGATRSRDLSPALTAQLRRLARDEGVTLFMLLLAGFKALLARYSGETDLCIGSPIAQRTRVQTESLIGFFVNMLALRTDLTGDPTFREILHRIRTTTLEAFEHQDVPFEKVVEGLNPSRHPGHQPVFQIAFVLESASQSLPELPELRIEPFRVPGTTAKFDLTLTVADSADAMCAMLEYSTDLFDAPTIDRLLTSLALLLAGAVAEPDARLSRLPILDPAERERLIVAWNDTALAFPQEATIHSLFEQCAARNPAAIALVDRARRISYGELNARANAIAHRLRALGVQPETFVGVCMMRSSHLLAALLGILKAGGAYVPMDPKYPADRLAHMLSDSRAPVVLCDAATAASHGTLQTTARWERADGEERADFPNLESLGTARNLAYLIYTSGSTGQPKGVALEHRNAVAFIHWARQAFAPEELAGVLAATSVCFDLSVFEMFVPLASGGTVILAENALELPGLPAANEVTLVTTVPSAMAELLRSHTLPPGVRTVNLAGEVLPENLVAAIHRTDPTRRICDLYGPTETTTYSTFTERQPDQPATIGRPIANTQIYLLDALLQPVPIGGAGEICIGGAGVARGYWEQPALTAERFIASPFIAGERIYKTGDLARWRADGNIVYLGRADHQVKVRGFRIEPGEIETALRRHSAVRQAVVLVRQIGEDRSLVAYLVAGGTGTPDDAALREFLQQQLPKQMIPAAFVWLPELPLTPNGKLDRHALPEPAANPVAGENYTPPRNAIQTQLVAIWEEVLSHRPIGIHDDFFALGGHSLLAARVTSLIATRLNARLDFGGFFDHPTIESHALRLTSAPAAKPQPPCTTLHPNGRQTPVFFFHGDVLGGGLFSKALATAFGENRPFHSMHPHGLQGDTIPGSIEAMAVERLEWIRRLQPHGPYLLGGYCNGALVAYQVARLLREAGESIGTVLMLNPADSNRRFRLMKRLCAISSALRGEDEAAQRRRFLKMRDAYCDREALARYYAMAAVDLLKQTPRVQVTRLRRKAGRILRHFAPRAAACTGTSHAPTPRHKEPIMNVYDDICRAHLAGYYDSPAVLFWPKDELARGRHGPATHWEKICPPLKIVDVPGDHRSCVAESANVAAIGEAMKIVIAQAENLPLQTGTPIS
ncbi:MAG: amino acid adenylation domain-containing protein, partial [Chthoniobacteraceae bacterium]